MRTGLAAAGVCAGILVMGTGLAAAQQQLTPDTEVPNIYVPEMYSEVEADMWDGPSGLFADQTGAEFDPPPGDVWAPQAWAVTSWDMGETVAGPSLIAPPGFFAAGGFVWAGVEPANDLSTDVLRLIAIQVESMLDGCEGVRREVAVSVARPGLDVFTAEDEFVGNPGIGHNLQISFALNDCRPEAFYLEYVGGQYASYQSRVGVAYQDNGEVAVVHFLGGFPTFDGPFTLSTAQSPLPFAMEDTFGYSSGSLTWPGSVPFPADLGVITLDNLADVPIQLVGFPVGPPPVGDGPASTTTRPEVTTTVPAAETTVPSDTAGEDDEMPAGGSFPILPVGAGGALVVAGGYVAWRNRPRRLEDATPELPPDEEEIPDGEDLVVPRSEDIRQFRVSAAEVALRNGARATDDGWLYITEDAWVEVAPYRPYGDRPLPSYGGDVFLNLETGDVLDPAAITTDDDRLKWIGLCHDLGIDPRPGLDTIDAGRPADAAGESDPESFPGEPPPETPPGNGPTTAATEPAGGGIDRSLQPVTVDLVQLAPTTADMVPLRRLQDIVESFRGTGDIAGVAESLWEFNEWHKVAYGDEWFTWTNDPGDGSLVAAPTVDDFLLSRRMCCFEFVHFCAFIASDQLGRPHMGPQGGPDGKWQITWGLLPRVFTTGTDLGDAVAPRGNAVTGLNRYTGPNTAGYTHIVVSLGDGNVIGLGIDGLEKEAVSDCFSGLTLYHSVTYGPYGYGSLNPAPANPK